MKFRVDKEENAKPFVIDVKRFYAPFKIHTTCEGCGIPFAKDFDLDYLMYPTLNGPFEEYLHCPECDHEHEVKLLLTMDLQIVEEKGNE